MGLEAGDERAARTRFSEIMEEDAVVYRDVASGESLVLPSTRPRKKKMKKSRSNGKTARRKRNDEVVSAATNVVLQWFLAIGAFTLIVGAQSIITGGKEDSSGNRSWGHEDNNSYEHAQKRKLFLRNLQQDGLSQSTITIPTPFPSNGASFTSYSPTFSPAYVCNPDPVNCGCQNLNQADYRGSVNSTVNGVCIKWDDGNLNNWWSSLYESIIFQQYPDSGLDENYCRNPDNDPGGPWCFTEPIMADDGTGYWVADYCDVSICSASSTVNPTSNPPSSSPTYTLQPTHVPSLSLGPSASSSPTTTCKVADKATCGCNLVLKSDYRGTISTTQNGADCERWDAKWMDFFDETLRTEGLDENYCRNPFDDANGPGCFTSVNIFGDNGLPQMSSCSIPACNPCMCMPDCDKSNSLKCGCPNALQADECCKGDDSECRCQYLKDACRKSIESNSTEFCDDAEVECCSNDANPNCKCAIYEQMCFEFPSQSACEYAALSCCKPLLKYDYAVPETCFCDFYTSTKSGYASKHRPGNCSKAEEAAYGIPENEALRSFYDNLGGLNWHNSFGWLDYATQHCQWFGISCNDHGLVTKIELRSNNIVGEGYQVFYTLVGALKELKVLNVANNTLTGEVLSGYIPTFMKLEHIDLSDNGLSGHADLTLPLSTLYVNFSHNLLSSVGFKRFNAAYETLKVVDLSNNNISQDASKLFYNIPPNIQELILSNNLINGNLSDSFQLKNVIRFAMANNKIEGTVPYFPEYAPLLQELDLSNQKRANTGGGLSGTISMDIYKLIDLSSLNLAGNMLSGEIPASIGNLDKLKLLNLSSNELSKQIPLELGRLNSIIEILDLSNNDLNGTIPSDFGNFDDALIHLRGNSFDINYPAPLRLCFMQGFDLMSDQLLCPTERNALKEFYDSAKGGEWTLSTNWTKPHEWHCEWYGVKCRDGSRDTVKLELPNNGLSGTLNLNITKLRALEVLDLNNNNIKGSIPSEIGVLSNLTRIRLSYNEFTGNETNFAELRKLKHIHLHGNRLSGTILSSNPWAFDSPSSFISDCGNPSDFRKSLICEGCTMCCNYLSYCEPQRNTQIQTVFNDYGYLSLCFILIIILVCFIMALGSYAYDKHRNTRDNSRYVRTAARSRDDKYHLEQIGKGSVYQFFAGKSVSGWCIVLLTIGVQFWLLSFFVEGSEIDLSDDKVDVVYTWKCPRDDEECFPTKDLNALGWIGFAVLVGAHVLADVINGGRMIVLSAKERHSFNFRARIFIGGTMLCSISLFTFFVSTIFNKAIATSNTEVLYNSILILVVTQIDELILGVLTTISPTWVESMVPGTPNPKEGQAFELSPLVEQPQSPNGHPSLQSAHYERKKNPTYGTSVSSVQHLQPALYECNENTTDGNSRKSFDLASVA